MNARIPVLVGLVGLAALGLPVGGWAALAAMSCFALGGLAAIVNAEQASKPCFEYGAGFLVFSIVLTAIAGGLRATLANPAVQLALGIVLVLLLLLGLVALAVKVWGQKPEKAKIPKFPMRERALIVEPIAPTAIPAPSRATPGRHPPVPPSNASSGTDELGIFRRRAP